MTARLPMPGLLLLAAACAPAEPGTQVADLAMGNQPAPDMAQAGACARQPPRCGDEQIQDLPLFKKASTRKVESSSDGAGGFLGRVDASAGNVTPRESYVYVHFAADRVERVAVGDEAALDSMDWDIAFRRFVVRINSGVSGPSCVTAAPAPPGADYTQLDRVPANLDLELEAYYDDACKRVMDGSGLDSPATRLASFWHYTMCVEMTGQVYVLRLADGRHIKLEITSYYGSGDDQAVCNDTHVPPAAAGADIHFRWAPLGS